MRFALGISLLFHALLIVRSAPVLAWNRVGGGSDIYFVGEAPKVDGARSVRLSRPSASQVHASTSVGEAVSLSRARLIEWGNEEPAYPPEAVRSGWEGEVLLHLTLNSAGTVSEARVDRSSGYRTLDVAALTAARAWHFPPDLGAEATIPIFFQIEN